MRKVKTISISITPETHEQIKRYAELTHQSVSGALTQLIWAATKGTSTKETVIHEKEDTN